MTTASTQTESKEVTAQPSPPQSPKAAKPSPDTPADAVAFRTTSLKDLDQANNQTSTPKSATQTPDAKSEFSQSDLVKCWMEYAESLTIEKVHLKNTLIGCQPSLKADFQLDVAVYNPSQKDEIANDSAEILTFLSRKLNNAHITMAISLIEKEQTDMVYTQIEKYNYLVKKNPALEELKEAFNLTLE